MSQAKADLRRRLARLLWVVRVAAPVAFVMGLAQALLLFVVAGAALAVAIDRGRPAAGVTGALMIALGLWAYRHARREWRQSRAWLREMQGRAREDSPDAW